jgi:hypothetical protein
MTHVITAALMRAQRIMLAALMSALLAVAAFMALSISTALAAQSHDTTSTSTALAAQWYPIGFRILPTPGTDAGFPRNWTREPPITRVRAKNGYGNIVLNLTDNVDGGICVVLVAARDGSRFGRGCWEAGEYGAKTLATNVLDTTRFTVWATKRHYRETNNDWAGSIYY